MSCKTKIEKILAQHFAPTKLVVRDDSALHAGHAGARESGGGHFSVEIVSERFAGLTTLARHRLIHEALYPQLKKEIHALTIKAEAP